MAIRKQPVSFLSPSDRLASGKACNRVALWMFAWGDAGYAAAARAALKDHPGAVLYDVKSDMKTTAVLLGAYAKGCTVVTGRIGYP